MTTYTCQVCNKPIDDYKPQICCSGFDCGCRGQNIEPPICSNECWDKLMGNNSDGYESLEKNQNLFINPFDIDIFSDIELQSMSSERNLPDIIENCRKLASDTCGIKPEIIDSLTAK